VVIKAVMVKTVTVAVFTIYFIYFLIRMHGLCAEFANISTCTASVFIFVVVRLITFVAIIANSQESFHIINYIEMVSVLI
jgi:hypothetical protein